VIQLDIISGFLGAGKTTFINKLLTETGGAGTVLVENEFGDVSIDGDILGGVEMLELSNGCICCSLSGNFVDGLRRSRKGCSRSASSSSPRAWGT